MAFNILWDKLIYVRLEAFDNGYSLVGWKGLFFRGSFVCVCQTTWHHILKDSSVSRHCCENHKSHFTQL